MALIYANGFEDGFDTLLSGAGATLYSGLGRRGGWAMGRSSTIGTVVVPVTVPNSNTIFAGFVFSAPGMTATASGHSIVEFLESGTLHVSLHLNSDYSLSIRRGTTVLWTGEPGFALGAYRHFQMKVVISDTVGEVEVRVDGSTTPLVALSGVDTRNGATGVINQVGLRVSNQSGGDQTRLFDDFVVWDSTGSTNNTWIGDVRVDSYMPTADGDTTTMTPSSGSEHWQLVDEVPASTADYVSSATVGELDLFQMGNMAHTPSTIHGVIAVALASKSDAGGREIGITVKSGATESVGTNAALSTTAIKFVRVMEADPNGGVPWAKGAVDALQVGVKVVV